MGLLINIDNGGTFTDACASDGERVVHVKAPTTPHDLTRCFVDVLKRAASELFGEEEPERLLLETDHLRYSTTSTTNAVVERKGAPVGLLVEAGEEEHAYGAAALAGPEAALWRAMVPNRPAGIRVPADGPPDEREITEAVNALLTEGVQRLVVSIPSRDAERAVKAVLLDRYPRHLLGAIPVLFSHELVRDPDDARRTLTAVLNSYLHSGLEHFLYGAENVVRGLHLRSPLLIFRNDGDSARVAKTTAIRTYGSGPRGGVEGAMAYARHYGVESLVSMDVGGTTTDLSVVREHVARPHAHGRAAGMETSFPMADVESVGIGGSSVFHVEDGEIRIGPDSVGATPGPACFGRGGGEATLTDALLLAGLLDPLGYLGGELRLDPERARAAVEQKVAQPLGLPVEAAVRRMWRDYEQAVARCVRDALDRRGGRPDESALLAYGGAGPMSACGVAAGAGIRRVIVPRYASVFSAFGIGFSDLAHRYQMPLEEAEAQGVEASVETLRRRAQRDMFGEGVSPEKCAYELALSGASGGYETVRPVGEGALSELRALAEREGLAEPKLRLRAAHPLPRFSLAGADGAAESVPRAAGSRRVDLGEDGPADVELFEIGELAPGATGRGPALIRDTYLTCFVRPGWRFRVTGNGDLLLEAA